MGAAAQVETYPATLVWSEAERFCKAAEAQPTGWVMFEPEPDTVLDYLRRPNPVLRDNDDPIYDIYSAVVGGRKLFAMKRMSETHRYCRVLDLEWQQKIDVEEWKSLAGHIRRETDQHSQQRIDWGQPEIDGKSGRIELRYKGWNPPTDSVGYLGLTMTFSERAEP